MRELIPRRSPAKVRSYLAALTSLTESETMKAETTRAYVSARFLLATKLAKRDAVDISGVAITQCRAKVARNARKVRLPGRGDAPTTAYAIRTTGVVAAMADRRNIRTYAYNGM